MQFFCFKLQCSLLCSSCITDAPPHGPEVIEEIQLDPTDYSLRLHDEHSYSIQSIAGAINHNIDVTNPSTHQGNG